MAPMSRLFVFETATLLVFFCLVFLPDADVSPCYGLGDLSRLCLPSFVRGLSVRLSVV